MGNKVTTSIQTEKQSCLDGQSFSKWLRSSQASLAAKPRGHEVANSAVSLVGDDIMLGTILLILLILMLLGSVPAYPYSREWGYYPSGGIGTILVIVLILVFLGRI